MNRLISRESDPAVRLPRHRVDQPIRLTICIPTYNRGAYIGKTLDSIATQRVEGLEVVVVDGASTDNTSKVVLSFRERLPNLIYHRGNRNMGVDRDMATAVGLARGEYCWLMSSDDLIIPGAIRRMLNTTTSGDDIYLCDVTLCDLDLRPIRDTEFLSKNRGTNRFDIGDRTQLLTYLRLARSNNALFCYMGSIIFRRARWNSVAYDDAFSGTGYAHVFTLFSFSKSRCWVTYVPSALVLNRADNDSFSSHGLEKRYMLDFNGYLLLADRLFGEDQEVRGAFLQVMTREHPWYRIAKLRAEVPSNEGWNEIRAKLLEFGYSPQLLALCGLVGRARFLITAALYLNKKLGGTVFVEWLRGRP